MFIDAIVIRRSLRFATITAAAVSWAGTAEAGDAEAPARVRQALSYLDARQDAWSAFASAKRGEGASRTTCVSCHTGITYVLARPALGRFATAAGPATPEERIVASVSLRVEHWAELDSRQYRLMYDSDDSKKVESRGTEAVINALVLARDDAARRRTEPSAAARQALQHLWATQATEGPSAGSWDWLKFSNEPWEADGSRAFGAALAAIAVGSAPGYVNDRLDEKDARGLALLRDYLRRRFPDESLYNRIWILEAATKLEGVLSADQQREVIEQLLALQRADGGWALAPLGGFKRRDGTDQPEDSDGYATGLVLHVLLRAGLPAARPELAKGLGWLRSNQRPDGSWLGRSVNKERDPVTFTGKLMSDAATAFSAWALVEAESP
jgi:squalene-hopene/tetraprenyl-beta-curcumene cyclase